ncbi:MAG: UPF0164 family protein, partial [Actinomycetia bacterium]|nr:UPF0164 family protein [Actinomycetes bacterium]
EDTHSFLVNPAGPALLKNIDITASHLEWYGNSRFESTVFSIPFLIGTISGYFGFMQSGYFEEIADYEVTGRNFFNFFLIGQVGFSARPIDRLCIGANIKVAAMDFRFGNKEDDTLENYTPVGIGADLGIMIQVKLKKNKKDWGLRLGLAGKNIGGSWLGANVKDILPISINGGIYFEYLFFGVTFNVIKRFDTKDQSSMDITFGVELFKNSFFIPRVSLTFNDLKLYLNAGISIRFQVKKFKFSLDYSVDPLSYIYAGQMGHTFSVELIKMPTELVPLWKKLKSQPRNPNPYRLIIADLVNIGRAAPKHEDFNVKVYKSMTEKLNAHPDLQVRNREKVFHLLKSWKLLPKALYDDDFVLSLGKKLQANFLIRGTYKIKNGVVELRIQVYDIETESIYRDFKLKGYEDGGFEDMLDELSTHVFFKIKDYLKHLQQIQKKMMKDFQRMQKMKDKSGAEKLQKKIEQQQEKDKIK